LDEIFKEYRALEAAAGRPIPENANNHKYLDCAVFQYAYAVLEAAGNNVDSSRAVYVPTGKDKRIWTRSWITRQAHIQICVRNPSCILGTWLVKPIEEAGDGESSQERSQDFDEFEDRAGGPVLEKDVNAGPHPTPGEGQANDTGGGRQGQGESP
jgi:hypothetical protein